MRKSAVALLLSAATAACGEGGEVPPEVAAARHEAARRACISVQLAQRAADELQTLEQSIGAGGVVTFARAFEQHAELRRSAYAQLDSAARHSPTPEDSARHARAAARYEIRTPEAGTVEANVIQDYERQFAAMYDDPDHPCNWPTEEE